MKDETAMTVSQTQLVKRDASRLVAEIDRKDISEEQYALVKSITDVPFVPSPCATTEQIMNHLDNMMKSGLAVQKTDDQAGKVKLAVYVGSLNEFSNEALSYMARRIVNEMIFFPKASECRAIAAQYVCPDRSTYLTAKALVHHYRQAKMQDTLRRLKATVFPEKELAALPDRIKAVAIDHGLITAAGDEVKYRPSTLEAAKRIQKGITHELV